MKPFEWKTIEEIWIMVFGKSCKLSKDGKEKILEMFEINQYITERQIIMEDNVNRARYFAEQRARMKNIFNIMSILR